MRLRDSLRYKSFQPSLDMRFEVVIDKLKRSFFAIPRFYIDRNMRLLFALIIEAMRSMVSNESHQGKRRKDERLGLPLQLALVSATFDIVIQDSRRVDLNGSLQ